MSVEDQQLLLEFIEESLEHLSHIQDDLLTLEEGGECVDPDIVNRLFRAMHTIKGGAGFFPQMVKIKDLAHALEDVVSLLRSGQLKLKDDISELLLTTIDTLGQMVSNHQEADEYDISDAVKELRTIEATAKGEPPPSAKGEVSNSASTTSVKNLPITLSGQEWKEVFASGEYIYYFTTALSQLPNLGFSNSKDFIESLSSCGTLVKHEEQGEHFHAIFQTILEPLLMPDLTRLKEENIYKLQEADVLNQGSSPPQEKKEPKEPREPKEPPKKMPSKGKESEAEQASLRVKLKTLDQVMKFAGELVLCRNQLMQLAKESKDSELSSRVQSLDSITSNLQLSIMNTRMQPLAIVFTKLTRMIRDLARKLDKKVKIQIEGKDVDMDKSTLEIIGDPLLHLIRNAVDHGIESPAERSANGKNETGKIDIHAYHQAGQVFVKIKDDGKGIDPEKVKKKALETGNFDASWLEKASTNELINLIFQPGFSLAKEISDVSGRGVGMDVVNSNLRQVGGSVEVTSVVGKGSTFTIKLPLTLAILPCLSMQLANQTYYISQSSIVRLLTITPDMDEVCAHRVADTMLIRFQGQLIPLVDLSKIFGLERKFQQSGNNCSERRKQTRILEEPGYKGDERRNNPADRCLNIFVVSTGAMQYGLIIDQFIGAEEVVVKPLSRFLKQTPCFAGTTIQGDGRVALILDIPGVAEHVGLNTLEGHIGKLEKQHKELAENSQNDELCFIFKNGSKELFAVPRNLVERILHVSQDDISNVSGCPALSYKGKLIPLVRVDEVLDVPRIEGSEHLYVMIFIVAGRSVGLIASEIIGIEKLRTKIEEKSFSSEGVLCTTLLGNEPVVVMDLFTMVSKSHPEWMTLLHGENKPPSQQTHCIVVADDSVFYRNQYKRVLQSWGYRFYMATDGLEALQLLEEVGDECDLVLTDVVMPNCNGLELTRRIRANPRFKHLPVIACSTLETDEDKQAGKDAGVDEYLVKLDATALLQAIDRLRKSGKLVSSVEKNLRKQLSGKEKVKS